MKTMEIYYSYLNEEAQEMFDLIFGPPSEFNHDIVPLFIYSVNEDEQEYDATDPDRQL